MVKGEIMKLIQFRLEDSDYIIAKKRKGAKTWAEYVTGK